VRVPLRKVTVPSVAENFAGKFSQESQFVMELRSCTRIRTPVQCFTHAEMMTLGVTLIASSLVQLALATVQSPNSVCTKTSYLTIAIGKNVEILQQILEIRFINYGGK